MATINLGNIRFNWLGEYKSTTAYVKDDVVEFDGSCYIAKKNTTGNTPENQDYWDLMISGAEKSYVIGEQKLMPFRKSELPKGWYFRNGDNYLLDSPQGRALNNLSANYKEDFKITIKVIDGKQYINVPTAFAQDGRGYFERAVNGVARQVGSVQTDALQNFTATTGFMDTKGINDNGILKFNGRINQGGVAPNSVRNYTTANINASYQVRADTETRSLNIGMLPAIYLGV